MQVISRTKITLTWHRDAGHEWLCVPGHELKLMPLSLQKEISNCSYQTQLGSFTYLEGDCDAGIYLDWLKTQGVEIEFTFEDHGDNASLRKLPRFKI